MGPPALAGTLSSLLRAPAGGSWRTYPPSSSRTPPGGADDAASAGTLLTPPFPADQRHLYEWMAEEIHRQLTGAAPRSYQPAPP